MGINNPNFPNGVLSETEAIQYLGSVVNALLTQTFVDLTGSPTLTGAQAVGTVVRVSGGATATLTTPTAAQVIARMQEINPNAGVGSTAHLRINNDNSGNLTVAGGTGVTLNGNTPGTLATATTKGYIWRIATANTVTLTAA